MERNYLLRVIRKKYTLLGRNEISARVEGNGIFCQTLQNMLKEQHPSLDDREYLPRYHRLFYDTVAAVIQSLDTCLEKDITFMKALDNVILVLSIYNEYSAISAPSPVCHLIYEAERRGLILG